MPIKGLTDRNAAFPEIGRIRKGAPKETDRPGKDLTYFRVEFDQNDRMYDVMWATFLSHYGPEPAEIDVLLPFPTVEENFETWREAYLTGGLVHRCDGENVYYETDPATGEVLIKSVLEGATHNPEHPVAYYGEENTPLYCKPTGRLRVILPALNRLAYLTFLTGSIHDIVNVSRQLEALYRFAGSLVTLPLILRRKPVKISTPDPRKRGKRVRREKWLVSVEANPRWVEQRLIEAGAKAVPMLPDTAEEIEGVISELPDEEIEVPNGAPTDDNNVGGDDVSQYFYACYNQAKLDRDTALAILSECDQDYKVARKKVLKQHVPPKK